MAPVRVLLASLAIDVRLWLAESGVRSLGLMGFVELAVNLLIVGTVGYVLWFS